MNKKLYLECSSGISGDMTVAALLDLGADETVLTNALKSLNLQGYEIAISRVKKAGIDACDFAVHLDEKHESHDHDMEYLHGHAGDMEHTGEDSMQEEACAQRTQVNQHVHESHVHEHRNFGDIEKIISDSDLTKRAKELAIRIFTILAEAEAKAHGVPFEEVHFHEVGAVDSIVDIVAVAVCVDNLGITEVITSELYEGSGSIRCQHGIIPVPVPAVVNIVKAHGLKLHMTGEEGEFVTPTGAAIVAALRTSEKLPKQFRILKTGIGAGKRKYNLPGILRAMFIEDVTETDSDVVYKLETNIDDCTGESLGFVMEQLLCAGARDVHYIPVYMKKNRPAYQLNVICDEADISKMEEVIFSNTTTIGIRRMPMERTVLKREIRHMQTSFGEVAVKICELSGETRIYPEYESVATVCRDRKFSYQEVYIQIVAECRSQLEEISFS